MRIIIVEKEISAAKQLSKMTKDLLKEKEIVVRICPSLDGAVQYILKNGVDVLFLDPDLKDQNGFELLKLITIQPFHVVVLSANAEKAVEAFEYNVLDFLQKPFSEQRVKKTILRLKRTKNDAEVSAKYFVIKKKNRLVRICEEEVLYFEAYGHYSKMHLKNGKIELHDKSLNLLEQLLDHKYERVHRSYIAKMTEFNSVNIFKGGKYEMVMSGDSKIPIGRSSFKMLKAKWFI